MQEHKWFILASLSKTQENGPQTEATEHGNTMCIRPVDDQCVLRFQIEFWEGISDRIQLFMICGLCLTFVSDRVKYEWNLF